MLKYRECSIILTDLCNIKCDHCYVSTTNKRKARRMRLDKLENYVSLLRKTGVEKINLTGGEPFLFLNELEDAIRVISRSKCKPTVITNAFWANDYNNTKTIISKLIEAGLAEIHFSTDRFHAKYIPIENVLRACIVATRLRIPAFVFVSKMEGDYFHSYLKERLTKTSARVIEQSVKLNEQKIHEFKKKYGLNPHNTHVNTGPCLSTLNPLIDTYGQMFICCSPIGCYDRQSLFFVTDLNEQNVALSALEGRHLLSQFLFEYGPVTLGKKILPRAQISALKNRCNDTCNLCNSLLGSEKYKEAIERTLLDFSPKHDLVYELQSFS